jgi:hypothetical protein
MRQGFLLFSGRTVEYPVVNGCVECPPLDELKMRPSALMAEGTWPVACNYFVVAFTESENIDGG